MQQVPIAFVVVGNGAAFGSASPDFLLRFLGGTGGAGIVTAELPLLSDFFTDFIA